MLSALEDHKTGIASRKFIHFAWFQATPVNNFTKITFTPICWFIYFYLSFNYLCHHVSKVRLKYHNEESTTSHFRPAFIIKVLFFGTMSIVYLGIFQWEKEIKFLQFWSNVWSFFWPFVLLAYCKNSSNNGYAILTVTLRNYVCCDTHTKM